MSAIRAFVPEVPYPMAVFAGLMNLFTTGEPYQVVMDLEPPLADSQAPAEDSIRVKATVLGIRKSDEKSANWQINIHGLSLCEPGPMPGWLGVICDVPLLLRFVAKGTLGQIELDLGTT